MTYMIEPGNALVVGPRFRIWEPCISGLSLHIHVINEKIGTENASFE